MNFILYSLLFLSSSLYLTDSFNQYGKPVMVLLMGIILITPAIVKSRKYYFNKTLAIIFYCFLLAGGISSLILGDMILIAGILALLIQYIALVIIFPTVKNNSFLVKTIMISQIPLLIISLLVSDFGTKSLQGIFYNPNSFGTVACTVYSVLLSIMLSALEKRDLSSDSRKKIFFKRLIIMFALLIVFTLVVVSGSRTSFITALVITFVGFVIVSGNILREGDLSKYLRRFLSLSAILAFSYLVVSFFIPINAYVNSFIIEKFALKSDNILDGRTIVWQRVMNEASLFGHGRDYLGGIGIGAHNTFISILGQYGIVPVTLFVLFFIVALYYCLRYSVTNNTDKYRHLPLLMLLTFLLLSMAEGMMFKLSMLAAFCAIGVSSSDGKRIDTAKVGRESGSMKRIRFQPYSPLKNRANRPKHY